MFSFRRIFSRGVDCAPTKNHDILAEKLRSFQDDEGGIATVWAVFWLIVCFALSGLAIDVTNAWKVQQFLQSTADVSALAGSYELESATEETDGSPAGLEEAVDYNAILFANYNMNPEVYGITIPGAQEGDPDTQVGVLDAEDVQVGHWDSGLNGGRGGFVALSPTDIGIRNAVRAITRQTDEQNHSVGTFFLRFAGFDKFSINTQAVASIFVSICEYDGLISAGEINLTMGQIMYDEFCIHGEQGIKAAQGNYISDDSVVSAPSYELCGQNETKCSEDTDANIGFEENFVEQSLFTDYSDTDTSTQETGQPKDEYLGKAGNIGMYIDSLLGQGDEPFEYSPPYVEQDPTVPLVEGVNYKSFRLTGNLTINDFLIADALARAEEAAAAETEATGIIVEPGDVVVPDGFLEGFIYEIECTSGKDINLAPTAEETWDLVRQVVIVGRGCDFVFAPDIQYYDIVIATDSTSRSSISSPEGITLGYHDGCDELAAPEGLKYAPGDFDTDPLYYGGAVTLLTQGSVHFASKFRSYDMEIIARDNVHLAGKPIKDGSGVTIDTVGDFEETTGINIHVGTTITTGGDIHVSRSHEFNGCLGRVSSNLFDPSYGWRLVL